MLKFKSQRHLFVSIIALLSLVLGSGCGHDHDHDHDHHDDLEAIIAEACLHARSGPFEDVSADTDKEQVQTQINKGHTAYRIDLAQDSDNAEFFSGVVELSADEENDYYIFTSNDAEVSVYDAATLTQVEVEEVSEISACVELSHQHVFELSPGEYVVEFGPTSHSSVLIVVEQAGEAHDHGHDH